jgi:large repetitive protein
MAFNQKYRACRSTEPAARRTNRNTSGQFLLPGILVAAAIFSLSPKAFGATDPRSPTTQWTPVLYEYQDLADPSGDQPAGNAELDIVGNTLQSSLYLQYDNAGPGNGTDGSLGFRLRIGADAYPQGYSFAAFVGLDANLDGKPDLFIGVNNLGCGDFIGIWSPGPGRNTSPKTTTLAGQPLFSYGETTALYGLTSVSPATDPSTQSCDLNRDHRTDQFLSFFVPFSDVLSALDSLGFDSFTASTPVAFLAATATHGNLLDGDLNGVFGGTNSRPSWSQLGAFSQVCTLDNLAPVPEPSAAALLCLGGSLARFRLLKRSRRA